MKNRLLVFFCLILFVSCSNDEDTTDLSNYKKVEFDSSTCTGFKENGKVIKKKGTVVTLYIEGMNTDIPPILLIRDQDGKEYFTCGLPEECKKGDVELIFSGITYSPDPLANYIYGAIDLKLTELWIKK